MLVSMQDQPFFENEDWLVCEGGLEHKATGYFIEREVLGSRRHDGLWAWPLHVAEKTWCRMPAFMEAFGCAVAAYGLDVDVALARSFSVARREVGALPPRRADVGEITAARPAMRSTRSPASARRVPANERRNWRVEPLGANRGTPARWRVSRPFRRAGTRLIQLLRAAWPRREAPAPNGAAKPVGSAALSRRPS
jgi:hypothetical protein